MAQVRELTGSLAVAGFFAACVPAVETPIPDISSFESVLLVHASEPPEVSAFDVRVDTPPVTLSDETTPPVYALLYQVPLETLGLESGPLVLAEEGQFARRIPVPAESFELSNDSWEALEAPPKALSTIWISGVPKETEPCPEIDVVEHALAEDAWPTVVIPLDESRVFFANEDGEFYVMERDRVQRIETLSSTVPHGGGHHLDNGDIVTAACGGEPLAVINRNTFESNVDLDRVCIVPSWGGTSNGTPRVTGSELGAPFEVFTLTRSGVVYHYRDTVNARQIYGTGGYNLRDFISWAREGEAIVTTGEGTIRWVSEEGGTEIEPVFGLSSKRPTILRARRLKDTIILAGFFEADRQAVFPFFDLGTERWFVLGDLGYGEPIYDMRLTHDGFAFGGGHGLAGWYTDQTGFCTAPDGIPTGGDQPFNRFNFHWAIPVNDNEVFLAGWEGEGLDTTNKIWWMRRR